MIRPDAQKARQTGLVRAPQATSENTGVRSDQPRECRGIREQPGPTVKLHVHQLVIGKFGVSDRTQAAVRAVEPGLVPPCSKKARGLQKARLPVTGRKDGTPFRGPVRVVKEPYPRTTVARARG